MGDIPRGKLHDQIEAAILNALNSGQLLDSTPRYTDRMLKRYLDSSQKTQQDSTPGTGTKGIYRPSYYAALFRKQANMGDRPMTRGDLEAYGRFLDEQAQAKLPRQLPSNPMDARVGDLADFAAEEIRKFGNRTGLSKGFEYAMGETPRSIAKNVKNYWGDTYDTYVAPKVKQFADTAGDWVKQKAQSYGPDLVGVGNSLKSGAKNLYSSMKGTLKGALDDLNTASDNIAKASESKKQNAKT